MTTPALRGCGYKTAAITNDNAYVERMWLQDGCYHE
jgi:hypothetical protein